MLPLTVIRPIELPGASVPPCAISPPTVPLPPSVPPVDTATVELGSAPLDTSLVTGETLPVLAVPGTAVFAGTHDKSVAAVKSGNCDAGFAFDDMVTKTAVTAGIIKATDIKIIWKSKGIPQGPIAVRTGLPDSLLVKIRQVLPNIDALYLQANKLCPDATPTCNLGGTSNSWAPVNDSFFDPIADVCKATQAAACFPPKR